MEDEVSPDRQTDPSLPSESPRANAGISAANPKLWTMQVLLISLITLHRAELPAKIRIAILNEQCFHVFDLPDDVSIACLNKRLHKACSSDSTLQY